MKNRLVNVRLDEERYRKVRALRDKGVALSDLMREAIDAKYETSTAAEVPRDVRRMIAALFERYPDPPGMPPREYDVHDRRAARAAVRRKLSRTPD